MGQCRKVIGAFTELDCTFESGRIVAIAFVTEEKAALADADNALWSDPSFWTTEDYSGDILIHQEVEGDYSPSPTTIPGKGTQQERNAGNNHTVTFRLESVKGNNKYMDDLMVSTNYRLAFVGDQYNTLFVSTTNVRITPGMVLENTLDSLNQWNIECVWSDIRQPESYDVPVGIFN